MSDRRDYWLHVEQAQACIYSAAAALRLALRNVEAGNRENALRWIARADGSLGFAAALIAWASSGSALAVLRRP